MLGQHTAVCPSDPVLNGDSNNKHCVNGQVDELAYSTDVQTCGSEIKGKLYKL